MANAQTLGKMSPKLLKVVERAKREPEGRFNSLAHLMDVPALERAYRRMRKDAALGVDGVTKELKKGNLKPLIRYMKTGKLRLTCVGDELEYRKVLKEEGHLKRLKGK